MYNSVCLVGFLEAPYGKWYGLTDFPLHEPRFCPECLYKRQLRCGCLVIGALPTVLLGRTLVPAAEMKCKMDLESGSV